MQFMKLKKTVGKFIPDRFFFSYSSFFLYLVDLYSCGIMPYLALKHLAK